MHTNCSTRKDIFLPVFAVDHFNKKEWSGHTKKRKSSSAVNPSSPGRQVESKGEISATSSLLGQIS